LFLLRDEEDRRVGRSGWSRRREEKMFMRRVSGRVSKRVGL